MACFVCDGPRRFLFTFIRGWLISLHSHHRLMDLVYLPRAPSGLEYVPITITITTILARNRQPGLETKS